MIDESNLEAIEIQELTKEFLDSIAENKLKSLISYDVKQTMYNIHECYNYEYRDFLNGHGIDTNSVMHDIFDLIDEDMFADYMHNRFGIEVKVFKRLEFVI